MSKAGNIKRYSVEELVSLQARGKSRTDLVRVRAKTDADIERDIASDPDWKDVDPNWAANAQAVMPVSKETVTIRLDADVLAWFRKEGPGYQTRINAVLKAYATRQDSVKV